MYSSKDSEKMVDSETTASLPMGSSKTSWTDSGVRSNELPSHGSSDMVEVLILCSNHALKWRFIFGRRWSLYIPWNPIPDTMFFLKSSNWPMIAHIFWTEILEVKVWDR